MRLHVLAGLSCVLMSSATVAWSAPPGARVERVEWRDAGRDRTLPITIRFPHAADQPRGPAPVMLVSHGLGGTREAMTYLGERWAAHGYLVVHLQHPGSDESVWRDQPLAQRVPSMRQAMGDPRNAVDRVRDVSFVLDQLAAGRDDVPLAAELKQVADMARVGIAGHSFGAWTVHAAVGMRMAGGSLQDERIKVGIPLSSPAPNERTRGNAYADITVPMLHATGSRDTSFMTPDTTPQDRVKPFELSPAGGKYLLWFHDADHQVFAGTRKDGAGARQAGRDQALDARIQAIVASSTLVFMDAHLRGDAAARAALADGALEALMGGAGEVRTR